MLTATVVIRSVHAKTGRSGWRGPGQAVYVVIHDKDGPYPGDHPLSAHNIKRFGWRKIYFGDGYWNHTGPRSMLGRALTAAYKFAEKYEPPFVRGGARDECRWGRGETPASVLAQPDEWPVYVVAWAVAENL
jgi:hypothetical protein